MGLDYSSSLTDRTVIQIKGAKYDYYRTQAKVHTVRQVNIDVVESYVRMERVIGYEVRRCRREINRSVTSSAQGQGKANVIKQKMMMAQANVNSICPSFKSDLDLYLEMNFTNVADLISFWTSKYDTLPYLSRFVEFYFIKMPSSGSVERLFSILANIDLPDRCSSSAKTLQNRMLYKENMNIYKKVVTPKFTEKEEDTLEQQIIKSVQRLRSV